MEKALPVLPLPLQHPPAATIDPETLAEGLRDEIQWFQALSEPVLPWPPRPHGGCSYQGDPDDFSEVVVPTIPGPEYTVPPGRMHCTVPEGKLHATVPKGHLHYTVPPED